MSDNSIRRFAGIGGGGLRRSLLRVAIVLVAVLAFAGRAGAIGWDSNDFLIGVGPSAITKIGVFDHDLTFKGFLDSNFASVQGLDFDHAGRLVAVGGPEVRVYDSSGAGAGGFVRGDLGNPGDIKVTPDASYVIGTGNTGTAVRRFLPDGTFVQQYGTAELRAVAVVPGNQIWTGGIGVGDIKVFDLATGMQTGTVSLPGFTSVRSLIYSSVSNTVLVNSGRLYEFDLQGNMIREFSENVSRGLQRATRGPNGDVFATTGSGQFGELVLHWNGAGDYLGSYQMPVDFGVNGIVWAGNAPEPSGGLLAFAGAAFLGLRRTRKSPTA